MNNVTIDIAKVLSKIENEKAEKERYSLYLTKTVYEQFREICGETPISSVVEELMTLAIASAKNRGNGTPPTP